MNNARSGRHHAEIIEGFLAPAQKFIALAVTLEFQFSVAIKRIRAGEKIHLHRMVNHQVNIDMRVDFSGIAAQARHRRAHCRQIDHCGYAGEILHHHAPWPKRQHRALGGLRLPARQVDDILPGNAFLITLAQHRFQHHADRKGQAAEFRQPIFFKLIQPINNVVTLCCF